MIDINELRRLAQAATPGGWYVARGNYVYGVKEVTDGEEVWHPVIACTDDDEVSINFEGNANFIAAANPAVINELLDRLEEAESDALEQARLNGMGSEREAQAQPAPSVPTALLVAVANLVAQMEIVSRVGFVDTPDDKDSCAAFCVAEGTWLELMSAVESLASALAAAPETKL